MAQPTYTLSKLISAVQRVLRENSRETWITAEISSAKTNATGHLFLELVDESEGKLVKASCVLWQGSRQRVLVPFEQATGLTLEAGMNIRARVTVDLHEQYGFGLKMWELDPAHSLGEVALRRKAVIDKLRQSGQFELNRQLSLPPVLQRLAIIASVGSDGLRDLQQQLTDNNFGYDFALEVFDTRVQGDTALPDLTLALQQVAQNATLFDAAVIVRGGGSRSDLLVFDEFDVASAVCQLPIPLICGIGHERDRSVVDEVAKWSLPTPSSVAKSIIEFNANYEWEIQQRANQIAQSARFTLQQQAESLTRAKLAITRSQEVIKAEKQQLRYIQSQFNQANRIISANSAKLQGKQLKFERSAMELLERNQRVLTKVKTGIHEGAVTLCREQRHHLDRKLDSIRARVSGMLQREEHHLDRQHAEIRAMDPKRVLQRGYSITKFQGHAVRNAEELEKGDTIQTVLASGEVQSIIQS